MTYLVEGTWDNPKGTVQPVIFYEAAMATEGRLTRGVFVHLQFDRLTRIRRLR